MVEWKFNLIPTRMRTSRNVSYAQAFFTFPLNPLIFIQRRLNNWTIFHHVLLTCLCISTFNPYDIS